VYVGGTSTGTVKDGVYSGGSFSGGTKVVDVPISKSVTWLSESGVVSGGFGMGGGGRGWRP